MRQEHSFKIDGMDCAEEISALTAELGPVFGEEHLRFDLMNAKLIVSSDKLDVTDEVISRVRVTGMKATPWESSLKEDRDSSLRKHLRTLLTTASGVALAAGFAWHALQHGVADALGGGEEASHVFPLTSIALYLAAILTGGWFIFPKAWFAARRLRPDMNLLMTVAVIGAVLISEWFEAATVTFLFAVALALESWSVGRARRAIGRRQPA